MFDGVVAVNLPDSMRGSIALGPTCGNDEAESEGILLTPPYAFGWRCVNRREYHGSKRDWNAARSHPIYRSTSLVNGHVLPCLTGFATPDDLWELSVMRADRERLVTVWLQQPFLTDSTTAKAILESVRVLPRKS